MHLETMKVLIGENHGVGSVASTVYWFSGSYSQTELEIPHLEKRL